MSISSFTFPAATLVDRKHVGRCCNLRPSPDGGLSATGRPRTVASTGSSSAQPVNGGHIILPDGSVGVLITDQGQLKAALPDGSVKTVASVGGAVTCALPLDDGFIIMTEGRAPRRFTCSLEGKELRFAETELWPDLPPLRIARHDIGTASADMPVLTLSSAYTSNDRHLSETDRSKVDKAMREAYINLSDRALLRGRYIQPVVARYRLIGEEGRTLYTSAPVVVAPETGLQGVTATLRLTGEGMRQCEISPLTATEFVPAIEATRPTNAVWDALVRSVQLLVSPQLHPYSDTLPGQNSRSAWTTTQITMQATLPGLDPSRPYAEAGTRIAGYITSILDNQDVALRVRATPHDTEAELQELRAIAGLRRPVPTPADVLAVSLSAPHTFTAATSARSGDLVAWGDLTVNPYAGHTLPEMTLSVLAGTSSLPTASLVSMHDGSSVVSTAVMTKSEQPMLSPLVTYPSADASSMTLIAGSKALTLPLIPTPGARCSYYLAPDLRPMPLTEEREGFAVPSASPRRRHYPSAVALCPVSAPFDATAVSHGDGAQLVALLPAMRHSNSFTVPSARFYMFGHGGISSMTLSDGRKRVNINLLYGRPVTSAGAVTPITGGVAALAGKALVKVTGSRPEVLVENCGGIALGWCDRYGELWCLNPPQPSGSDRGEAMIMTPDRSAAYTRDGLGPFKLLSTMAGMHLITASGDILDPSDETDAPTTVKYSVSKPHGISPRTSVPIAIPLYAHGVTGSVTIGATHGDPRRAAATLRTLTLRSGEINHPLREQLRIPHSHALTLSLSITTSHPSLLHLCQP